MKHHLAARAKLVTLLVIGVFASAFALAAPLDHGRNDRGQHSQPQQRTASPPPARHAPQQQQRKSSQPRRAALPPVAHFEDRHRSIAHNYFQRETKGRCPSGLKHRGAHCVANGPRAWTRGRVLPRTVIYYDVPAPLLGELPPPPRKHRYVRVAGDILLIAIGTGMVVDAIQDIFD
jgi:Ni/Co efflux regulator RcnB